jgi:large subunit ribosomal protein L16
MVLKSTKPKNTKFNKYFRPLIKDKFKKRDLLYTGGIICKESGYITDVQLQAIVLSIKRILKKRGKVILRVFPHRPITKKPIQVRMGKGKGPIVN